MPPTWSTVFAEVHGDLDEVLRMLASVRDLPADDPRLRRYALRERYEQPSGR